MLQTITLVLAVAVLLLLLIEAERKRRAKHRRVPAHRLTWYDDTRRAIGLEANATTVRWY